MLSQKTFKRETAIVCLVYLGYIGLVGRLEVIEILAWPIFLFVGAAFGMDWTEKAVLTKENFSAKTDTK